MFPTRLPAPPSVDQLIAGFDRTLDLLDEEPEMKPRGEAVQLV